MTRHLETPANTSSPFCSPPDVVLQGPELISVATGRLAATSERLRPDLLVTMESSSRHKVLQLQLHIFFFPTENLADVISQRRSFTRCSLFCRPLQSRPCEREQTTQRRRKSPTSRGNMRRRRIYRRACMDIFKKYNFFQFFLPFPWKHSGAHILILYADDLWFYGLG